MYLMRYAQAIIDHGFFKTGKYMPNCLARVKVGHALKISPCSHLCQHFSPACPRMHLHIHNPG